MDKIKKILETLEINKSNWKEIETKEDLFQFNYYMRFFDVMGIDKEFFKNKKYKKVSLTSTVVVDEIFKNFLENTEEKYGSYIANCYFVKLLAQRYPSRQYYETEEYENVISQLYIPILTNNKNSFCVDDKIIYPSPGEELFVGNGSLFAVYNLGETDIVYLCVDLISKKYFE